MLPFAKYDNQRFSNVHSVFPPLVGSHRKFKVFETSSRQILGKKQTSPFRGEQQQADFLSRMRKARQIILSHQKSKIFHLKRNHRLIERSKTDNSQKIMGRIDEKGNFSQVIYKIGDMHKKNNNKQSSDTQRFNDKILRQCKSQFMPNHEKKGKYFFNIPKRQHTQRSELRPPKSILFDQSKQSDNHSKSTQKLQIESSQQKLMEYLFPQQMIKSNGQLLIEKLKRCREEKQNPEVTENKNKGAEITKQQEQSSQQRENSLKFPFGQRKSKQHARSKFLCHKKERKNIKLRFGSSDQRLKIRQSSQELQHDESFQQKRQFEHGEAAQEQTKQDRNQKSMQLKPKKQNIKAQSKSVHIDENFKLDGWSSNPKLSTEYQIF